MIELAGKMMSSADAFSILVDIEQASRTAALQLPQSSPVRDMWDGLVFRAAGVRLVASMTEISEMNFCLRLARR